MWHTFAGGRLKVLCRAAETLQGTKVSGHIVEMLSGNEMCIVLQLSVWS
jgi:hypothetical protein